MTPEEEQKLLAMGEALDAVSPWQPVCVREALLGVGSFAAAYWHLQPVTLRMWLQLEEVKSPALDDLWHEHAEVRLGQIMTALEILQGGARVEFGELVENIEPEALGGLLDDVVAHVNAVFRTSLNMLPPGARTESTASAPGGFGWILPLYTHLREALGCSHDEAMDTPIARAFCLRANSLWKQGWSVDGLGYAQAEAIQNLKLEA
jgi:hypothetical protein